MESFLREDLESRVYTYFYINHLSLVYVLINTFNKQTAQVISLFIYEEITPFFIAQWQFVFYLYIFKSNGVVFENHKSGISLKKHTTTQFKKKV